MKNIRDIIYKKIKTFDLFYQNITAHSVYFENNCLKNIEESYKEGYGLRIIKNSRIGFAAATNLSDTNNFINSAIDTSSLGEKAFFKFPDKKFKPRDLKIYSKDTEKINSDDMIEWGEYFVKNLLKLNKKLKIGVNISKTIIKKQLVNSNGLVLSEEKTILDITLLAFRVQENNFLEIYDIIRSIDKPDKKALNTLLSNVRQLYIDTEKEAKINKGYYKAFFTPKAVATLISLFTQSFDGKLHQKKISFFCDKINNKFIKSKIDIIDNPLLEKNLASGSFDGDGLQRKKIYLVKNGVIKDYTLDMQTAGKMKQESNAHSSRSYAALPGPGFTNIIFQNNDPSLTDTRANMIKGLDEGIIVDQFIGAGQSNIIAGEFSANIDLGFYVKNGKIKGRIKNAMISGNFFDFFNNIIKIENKNYQYSNMKIPGILFDNMSINTDNK